MKKILVISAGPLKSDGMTKLELDIIEYNKDFFEFTLCSGFDADPYYVNKLNEIGVKLVRLSDKSKAVSYMLDIFRLVRKDGFSTVYIHGNSSMMIFEALPSKLAGAKVITHCHNTKSNYPMLHSILKPVFNIFVDVKIGCSHLATEFAYMGRRQITIPNGIDINKFAFDEAVREKIRNQLGLNDKKIIGHIGRFSLQKNHKKLIGIFDEMHKLDENVRLMLVGEGELLEDIRNDIHSRNLDEYVIIQNFTDRPQDYMQAFDLMIMPSLYEGLSLVALEAQANGLPLLVNTFFAPETFASSQIRAINLSLSDKEWALRASKMIKKGRKNADAQSTLRKMDQELMMRKIQRILMKV